MSSELATAPITPGFHKATTQLSTTLGIEPRMMVDTLKKQCFPSMRAEDVSDAQLAAFISVANTMDLNPLIPGMLYAYPSKNGGIVPVSGPDGVLKKLDEAIVSGKLDGYECTVFPEDVTLPPTHAIAKIFRAGKEHPSTFTAIFKEWCVSSNGNWASRPRHMIWLRGLKQCARQVIHGVPFDEDDVKIGGMIDVTPEAPPERPAPPTRVKKGAAAVQDAAPKTEAKAATMEAEIVPPQVKTAVTTPPPAQEPTASEPPAKEDPPAPTPASKNPKLPRASIKDGEELTMVCTVDKVYTMIIKSAGVLTPSVQASVLGDFVGNVIHIGGATQPSPDADLVANPEWKAGSTVTLHLLGKANTTGKVVAAVQKIIPQEATPESQAMEMD